MQESFGLPLISMLHEPHFPALQFQRHARSGACSFCTRWIKSSTTMPGSVSTVYSSNRPPDASPRQARSVRVRTPASDTARLQVLERRVRDLHQLFGPGRSLHLLDDHLPAGTATDDQVVPHPFLALALEVDA